MLCPPDLPVPPPAPAHRPLGRQGGRQHGGRGRAPYRETSRILRGFASKALRSPGTATAPAGAIPVIEAGHPVPDQAGIEADLRAPSRLAEGCWPRTTSSWSFSPVAAPPTGSLRPGTLTLDEKQGITRALLAVRRPHRRDQRRPQAPLPHQGRPARPGLARVRPPVLTLAISDVPHDDPAVIASGPHRPGPLDPRGGPRHRAPGAASPFRMRRARSAGDPDNESPKPGDRGLRTGPVPHRRQTGRCPGGRHPRRRGGRLRDRPPRRRPRRRGPRRCGLSCPPRARSAPQGRPARLVLSGRRTHRDDPRHGRGGPNQEYALALALALDRTRRDRNPRGRYRRHRRGSRLRQRPGRGPDRPDHLASRGQAGS